MIAWDCLLACYFGAQVLYRGFFLELDVGVSNELLRIRLWKASSFKISRATVVGDFFLIAEFSRDVGLFLLMVSVAGLQGRRERCWSPNVMGRRIDT